MAMMRTLHLDPASRDQAALVTEEIDRMLVEGKHIAVTIAEERELLSPQQAAGRLGFSRQHVMRLIGYGDLQAQQIPGSTHWKIPLSSVLAFEAERERGDQIADDWSRELEALGAPAE
jgi:excisionase family DNA binding protein